MMNYSGLITGVAALLVCVTSSAEPIRFLGEAGIDYRHYLESPQFEGQIKQSRPELVAEPELELFSGDRSFYKFKGFYRLGSREDYRNHGDVRELYWLYTGDVVDITVGVAKVFWGVTESRHLVDMINQSDIAEDIDEEEKLGQPMVNISWTESWGTLSFYWLPYFRKREFPDVDARLQTMPPTITDSSEYTNGRHNNHRDVALRYSTTLDDFDVGLYVFRGYGRQPWLLLSEDGTSLIPTYAQVTQVGADLQYTKGAWLWKFEGIGNRNDFENFTSFVAGTEYTFYQIAGSAADFGVLAEYLRSDRDKFPPDVFDNDIFVGGRVALNNIQDSSLLVGAIFDAENGETAIRVESETRIQQSWTIEVNAWIFTNTEKSLASYDKDDHLELKLRFHF